MSLPPHEHSFPGLVNGISHCECGAKIQVVEPRPVMVNCYWGVIGYDGRRGDTCRNRIVKGSEPPYCPEHQAQIKLTEALEALKGKVITGIELGHYPAVTIRHESGSLALYAEHDERYGDDFVTWSLS